MVAMPAGGRDIGSRERLPKVSQSGQK